MVRYSQRQIRNIGNAETFWRRLKAWQSWNNTTGLPRASELGLECIGYSAGTYGCNGSLYRDTKTGEMIGIASYACHIYVR